MKQIRLAKIEDAKDIALLGRITFNETFGALFKDPEDLRTYLNQTFSVKKIASSLGKTNNVFWIAFVDGLPVGYAKLRLKSPTSFMKQENVSQLQKIYVLKDFLSMKIGKRLQEVLISEAAKNGSQEIWLSVLESNQRAIRFYEKNDFKTVGEHKFSIGKETFDFVAMSKQL
ncbi:N-acetyltransferase family protein [Maribacter sp. 2308TA10-17]|uniref:GNAT family N-acetyltransferase n=1 Tax=Maribacter sp. 2308TA10-17 TaxID=3386276 RepID=UPI0039BC82DE